MDERHGRQPQVQVDTTRADDYKSKVLSARGGAGQRTWIQNRPAGLRPDRITQNHLDLPGTRRSPRAARVEGLEPWSVPCQPALAAGP